MDNIFEGANFGDKLSFFEEEYKKSHSEYMSGVCDGIRSVEMLCLTNNDKER